jgi:polysaccharide biosynthesis protein PslG
MLVLVAVAWVLSAPAQRLVVPGPPRRVETLNPKMGVHTRLTDEVEEWKIQQTLAMVRQMGSPWVVEYFPWAYYEPSPGRYEWDHADIVVDHAVAQGLTVLARIDYVPEWARPEETTTRYLDDDGYAGYAAFVGAFVDHFQGRIRHVIIWNEPNLSFEWGYRDPDPMAYTELLRQAYIAAKATDPDVMVLAAGLAPTLAPVGDPWGMDELVFLQGMYDAGAGQWFDGMAAHTYGLSFPADEEPAGDRLNFRRVELLHEVMVANGDGDKPVYITEAGWNDHPRWARGVSPYARIEYTVDAYQMALDDWDWCEALCMWAFRYPWPARSFQDGFTFVTPEFVPKPIYAELARYAHGQPFEYLEP